MRPDAQASAREGSSAESALPDAQAGWLARSLPRGLRPYVELARLDRPIGWWLLLLPCWWSAALAGIVRHSPPNPLHLALFLVGAIAMRGAGSTYNDIVDRDLDAGVARTSRRPIPSGRASVAAAAAFLVAQALVGLGVLLSFNRFTIALSIGSLAIVAAYPFMKRVTSWPQAVLGLAFSWGALVGWAADFGSLGLAPALLYVAAVAWTMGYDTIYALQDIEDDALLGIGSTARRFGSNVRIGVGVFYLIAALLALYALLAARAGLAALLGWGAFAAHLAWQTRRVSVGDAGRALALFRSNRDAGLLLFAGLAAEAVLKSV